MYLPPLIQDLALILATAAAVAFIFHRLRQPVVVGYILAGAFVGPRSFFPSMVADLPNIRIWADLGVIFLMFHMGLEFSFRRFQKLGFSLAFVGFIEILLMMAIGMLGAHFLGYHGGDPLFIGGMIAISSTTIIVKALDELGLRRHRFAERVFGLLILEDLAAVLLIVVFGSVFSGQRVQGSQFFFLLGELLIVIGGWYIIGALSIPRFVRRVGKEQSDELLTVLAIGLCLLLAVTAAHFHYSMALGAFIMGSVIAETRESQRIARLIHPLRDVFVAVFFVSVGMLANFSELESHPGLVAALVALVIGGKFISIFTASLIAGQNLRQSTRVAMSMGQIGEFSFIIAGLGITTGRMSPELQPAIVAASIITSFATPYLIRLSDPFSRIIDARLATHWKRRLSAYGAWVETMAGGRMIPRWIKPGLPRLLINAILVGLIFGGSRRFLLPIFQDFFRNDLIARAVGFLAAITLAAPFLFAMLTAAAARKCCDEEAAHEAALRAFFYFLFTIIWMSALSAPYVTAWASTSIAAALAIFLAFTFYRRLELSYAWLEKRFLASLESDDLENETQKAMRDLAPWDAHLVRLLAHPNSSIIGLPLHATGLRREHGLSIIAIRRGARVIAMPSSTELVLPHDELLVLGTDEQIDHSRAYVEGPTLLPPTDSSDLAEYEVTSVRVREHSVFAHQTIQESGIRERHGGLIVGVERGGQRILTPPPDFPLWPGDLLWIVGLGTRLREIE